MRLMTGRVGARNGEENGGIYTDKGPASASNTPAPWPSFQEKESNMMLRHSTPTRNLGSINRAGLLTSKSKGKLPVVWLHSPSRSAWAVLHVSKRHKVQVSETVTIEVELPRSCAEEKRTPGLVVLPG